MSGLCGWLGTSVGARRDAVLAAMQTGIFGANKLPVKRFVGEQASILVASNLREALYVAPEDLLVAIDGRPRWERESLQKLASKSGWGASVAEGYRVTGEAFLNDLKGCFALALIDLKAGKVLAAIDRTGVHSLAYANTGHGIVFGTSLDALRNHPSIDSSVTPQAIYRYLTGFVSPAPCTMYAQCKKLMPAFKLEWQEGESKVEPYWHIPYDGSSTKSFPELKEEMFSILSTSIGRAMNHVQSNRPIGAFLSGGLDSSAVCGLMQNSGIRPVSAFTIIFEDDKYDESMYAREVAKHFQLDHHEYCLTHKVVESVLLSLATVFDEPFGNNSAIPTYCCAKLARDAGAELIVAGDGGDEIFAGNKRYLEQKILSMYFRVPYVIRGALEASILKIPEGVPPALLAKCQRYITRAKMPMPERMHTPQTFNRQQIAEVFADDAMAAIDIDEPYDIWRRNYYESGTDDLIYSMMFFDVRTALADNDLRKVGRACDLAGIEVAFPMLDEDLIEFAAKIPSSLLIRGLELRYFFRKAMEGFLPQKTLRKEKHGFAMPFWQWARKDDGIAEIVDSCFEGLRSRRVFRKEFLDRVLREHRSEDETQFDSIIYDLIMLELWQRNREAA